MFNKILNDTDKSLSYAILKYEYKNLTAEEKTRFIIKAITTPEEADKALRDNDITNFIGINNYIILMKILIEDKQLLVNYLKYFRQISVEEVAEAIIDKILEWQDLDLTAIVTSPVMRFCGDLSKLEHLIIAAKLAGWECP